MGAELVASENVARVNQGLSRDMGTCTQETLVQGLGEDAWASKAEIHTYIVVYISTSLTIVWPLGRAQGEEVLELRETLWSFLN